MLVTPTALPYRATVQSVIETAAYLRAAKLAGMTDEECRAVVDLVASRPDAGDVMPGCGGARKLRVARRGGGKSGGYRVVSFFAGRDVPVFLLTVFPKNVRANLSKAEQDMVAAICKRLVVSLKGE